MQAAIPGERPIPWCMSEEGTAMEFIPTSIPTTSTPGEMSVTFISEQWKMRCLVICPLATCIQLLTDISKVDVS